MAAALVVLMVLNLAIVLWLARANTGASTAAQQQAALQDLRDAMQAGNDRLERELRREIADSSRAARQEATQNQASFQQTLTQQSAEATRTQNTQMDAFGQQLSLFPTPSHCNSPA